MTRSKQKNQKLSRQRSPKKSSPKPFQRFQQLLNDTKNNTCSILTKSFRSSSEIEYFKDQQKIFHEVLKSYDKLEDESQGSFRDSIILYNSRAYEEINAKLRGHEAEFIEFDKTVDISTSNVIQNLEDILASAPKFEFPIVTYRLISMYPKINNKEKMLTLEEVLDDPAFKSTTIDPNVCASLGRRGDEKQVVLLKITIPPNNHVFWFNGRYNTLAQNEILLGPKVKLRPRLRINTLREELKRKNFVLIETTAIFPKSRRNNDLYETYLEEKRISDPHFIAEQERIQQEIKLKKQQEAEELYEKNKLRTTVKVTKSGSVDIEFPLPDGVKTDTMEIKLLTINELTKHFIENSNFELIVKSGLEHNNTVHNNSVHNNSVHNNLVYDDQSSFSFYTGDVKRIFYLKKYVRNTTLFINLQIVKTPPMPIFFEISIPFSLY